jgi:hypothetical protein
MEYAKAMESAIRHFGTVDRVYTLTIVNGIWSITVTSVDGKFIGQSGSMLA